MFQFNHSDILRLRNKKGCMKFTKELKVEVQELFEAEILVPTSGLAEWGLYYYCETCSVPLEYDREKPHHHKCPNCNTVYSGLPFDNCWWTKTNNANTSAAMNMGLIYLLSGDKAYGLKAKEIVLKYAENYSNYEPHGNIPYNNQGRAGAQTIDEANFIRPLMQTLDLTEDLWTSEEIEMVKSEMFLPSAFFMKTQCKEQLHNHEVLVCAAISMIGIYFENKELINFGLYEAYGLKYQLEKGVLEDGFWFEGTLGYHFYAFHSFIEFEKFARYTEYRLIDHGNYKKMLDRAASMIQPNWEFPRINDTMLHHCTSGSMHWVEFLYKELAYDSILEILKATYISQERDNLQAFLYGVENLPDLGDIQISERHHNNDTVTILRGSEDRYLLFKHGPFGGEHDHYDRLGISYLAFNKPIAEDFGTTGYGAKLHYDYFKNTATHNLVAINEKNQPPAKCVLNGYKKMANCTFISYSVDFDEPVTQLDSFTIKQWDEKAYKGVKIKRDIYWFEKYFVDVVTVATKEEKNMDWIMHFGGERLPQSQAVEKIGSISQSKPLKYLSQVEKISNTKEYNEVAFNLEGVQTRLHSLNLEGDLYYGLGPNNPSTSEVNFVINRLKAKEKTFINVIESFVEAPAIEKIYTTKLENGQLEIKIKGFDHRENTLEVTCS